MKKIFFLVIVIKLILMLASCSPSESIIGRWEGDCTYVYDEDIYVNIPDGVTETVFVEFTFFDNDSYFLKTSDSNSDGTYAIADNQLKISPKIGEATTFEFKLNGKKLVLLHEQNGITINFNLTKQ